MAGILGLMASDFAAAERRLLAMARAEPRSFDVQFTLGFIYSRRQDYGAAAAALTRAVALDPASQVALFNLGYCRQQQGDLDAALGHYRAAARASGGRYGDAVLLAARCQHRLGDPAAAAARLEAALADHADDARIRYALMSALGDAGNGDGACRQRARLVESLADRETASGLATFFNRYDHHAWSRLDDKASLAALLDDYRESRGVAAFPHQPASFVMPGGFAALEAAHGCDGGPWIVKPAVLFGGQGVTITDKLDAVPREAGWLAQRYIAEPCLIDGKKFHLRLYLLVTAVDPPRAWLWRDGVVRFAPELYTPGSAHFGREAMHVTNTVRFQGHPDLVISDDAAEDGVGNVWSLAALARRIADQRGADIAPALEGLAAGLVAAIDEAGVFAAQAAEGQPHALAPKLLGLDVLLDDTLHPWLLEVERYPALGGGAAAVVEAVNRCLLGEIAALAVEAPVAATARQRGFTPLISSA